MRGLTPRRSRLNALTRSGIRSNQHSDGPRHVAPREPAMSWKGQLSAGVIPLPTPPMCVAMAKARTRIPPATAARVLFATDRTCRVCRQGGRPVQLHHVDGTRRIMSHRVSRSCASSVTSKLSARADSQGDSIAPRFCSTATAGCRRSLRHAPQPIPVTSFIGPPRTSTTRNW